MVLSCHVALTLPRVKTETWHVATKKVCRKKLKNFKKILKIKKKIKKKINKLKKN